jgi:tripartite-type tricarboxylate transporter receptor subunit TctC
MDYVANEAPKDGLTVGAVQNSVGYEALMDLSGEKAHFDLLKVDWVGSMTKEVAVTVLWNPPPVRSLQEAIDKKVAITVGSTSPTTSATIFPRMMNSLLGTRFKIVNGYVNQAPIWTAMERGELQGAGAPFYSSLTSGKPDWVRDKKVTLLVQMALEKIPALPNVPLLLDFIKTQRDRQEIELAVASLSMGRPYVLPGGTPPDRARLLRDSFMETMKDPELLDQAKKEHLDINPIDGPAVRRVLVNMFATPQPIVDEVARVFKGQS